MQIVIKLQSGKVITLEVDGSFTIAKVKHLLCCAIGFTIENCSLVYAGCALEDARSLADYDIPKEATLYCICRASPSRSEGNDTMMLTIHTSCGDMLDIQATPHMTIHELIKIISIKTGKSPENSHLYHGQIALSPSETIAQACIQSGTTLMLRSQCLGGEGGSSGMVEETKGPSQSEIKSGQNGEFDKSAPDYRHISPGFSVRGKCANKSCVASGDIVYKSLQFGTWSMNDVYAFESKCPKCKRVFKPTEFAFYNCFYTLFGSQKDANGTCTPYNLGVKAAPREGYYKITVQPLPENATTIEKEIYNTKHTWMLLKIVAQKTREAVEEDRYYQTFCEENAE